METARLKVSAPSHGWNWDDFSYLCEMEYDTSISHSHKDKAEPHMVEKQSIRDNMNSSSSETVGDETNEELDRCWDQSPEQYELTEDFLYDGGDLIFHSTRNTTGSDSQHFEPTSPCTSFRPRLQGTPHAAGPAAH